jgi:hypothetical protein
MVKKNRCGGRDDTPQVAFKKGWWTQQANTIHQHLQGVFQMKKTP